MDSSPLFRNKSRLAIALVIVICLVGLFLRAYLYGLNRSLWFDEAELARNLVNRSFIDLLKPLDSNQGAPIGFLLLQKAVISLLGSRDYILRLVPLLAGLASVPLIYLVSKQYGGQLFSCISLALFAVSPRPVHYSSELKQYSTDLLAALVLLLIVPKCLEGKPKPRALVALGIAGAVAIWLSHPSLFVLAGIAVTLAVVFAVRRDSRRFWGLIGIGAVWLISLGLLYFISLRHLASNDALASYWSGSFAPIPSWSNLGWYYDAWSGLLKDPAALPVGVITVGLMIVGIFSLAIGRLPLMSILVSPFLLTLIASALGKYPFSGRLLIFLVPLLLLLVAAGVDRVRVALLKVNGLLAWLVTASLVIYLLWGPLTTAYENLESPPLGEHIKPAMSYLSQGYQDTDLIYLYIGAEPAFAFYAPLYGFDRDDYIVGVWARNDPTHYLEDVDKLRGNPRVWFVFSHNCSWCTVNEQDFILEHLDKIGVKRGELVSGSAAVYLYDLTEPVSHPVRSQLLMCASTVQ